MSVLQNQTAVNQSGFLFLLAQGNSLNVNTISSGTVQTGYLNAGVISTNTISSGFIDCGTISTSLLDLDGQVITANSNDLLLNGIPIATTSNISSLADWSLDPAISTVNMAGNNLINGGTISTATVVGNSAFFNQLMAINSMFLSTYTSTVSSLVLQADLASISSLSTGVLEGSIANISSLGVSSLNAGVMNLSTLNAQTATISSLNTDILRSSTIINQGVISTNDLEVSSINGHEFTENTATISTIFSNNISSVFGDFQVNLTSTLQFNPSFNPSLDVNLGLGSLFGNLGGAALGGIGVLVGGAALGTGIAALTNGRQTNNINSNAYELINGTTQLQISSLGTNFSTVYRYVSSASETTPGQEYFVSTIHAPGVAIRSMSDPLNTVSSPNSTIQSFGQWVALDANLPIPSTVSTYQQLFTSSLAASTINMNNGTLFRNGVGYGGTPGVSTTELFWSQASPPLDANLRIGGLILSGDDVGGLNYTKDVLIQNQNNGNRITVFPGTSTIAYLSDLPSTVSSFNTLQTSTLVFPGISTITLSTVATAGTGGQPAGRLVMTGCDLDLAQNDLWAQQIRLGAGNPSGSAQTEIIFYSPDNLTQRGFGIGGQDRAVRTVSTINAGGGGYLLDTSINPPFFSSIGGNINMMAFFPSTNLSTIGASTISILPNLVINQSSIFTSSIQSIGSVSSLSILPNASCSQIFTTVGDIDYIARDFFVQAQNNGVPTTTLNIASSGAGGNGLWQITNPLGTGLLLASTITVSTNQMSLRTVPIPQQLYGRSTLSGGTVNIVFSPPYADSNEYSVLATYKDAAGGNPLHANILSVSSFSINGVGTNDFFWQTIGRV